MRCEFFFLPDPLPSPLLLSVKRKASLSLPGFLINYTNLGEKHHGMQALQKGPKFGTWSQMGPKCQNGPKKVPILLPSPKFLILPSDDAEKGRHIAVSHCCALFGHLQCIMCMSLILSGPRTDTSRLSSKSSVLKVACPQSRLSSKSCPQSRLSSMSHSLSSLWTSKSAAEFSQNC